MFVTFTLPLSVAFISSDGLVVEKKSFEELRRVYEHCAHCGGPADLVCNGCKKVVYSNTECQRADWRRHKVACKQSDDYSRTESEAFFDAMYHAVDNERFLPFLATFVKGLVPRSLKKKVNVVLNTNSILVTIRVNETDDSQAVIEQRMETIRRELQESFPRYAIQHDLDSEGSHGWIHTQDRYEIYMAIVFDVQQQRF